MTTPDELSEQIESEDQETEIVKMSGAIVLDSEYHDDFVNALQKLFDEYVYLDDNYRLEIESESITMEF